MGLQNFVLSGSSGFSFDFEIYTGAQGPVQSDTNLPKISTSSDVVVHLSRTIPEGLNYKLFFDNWRTLADSDPYLPLADFKCAVAEGFSQSNKPSTSGKRGRPSYELENAIEAKKLRGPIAIMPSRDVRLDQIDHMPLWTTRQRQSARM
ncbi:hypothetical protein EVAR_88243_1 [Eumeta japonica]|uniref:Uncharacterized protein n=1 Tax=Eumeta variegata TaxID=151549 RepID=A0A4C1Z277_EUMVA|nr:hypothetical protein EVAR_88243_1 [Eumeta japonica]